MDLARAYNVLIKVAEQEGITVDEVILQIESGIAAAIDGATRENDKVALEKWKCIPCAGTVPNAVELLAYLGEKARKEIFTEIDDVPMHGISS